MARYHEIADDLRARITGGEFAVNQQLPVISELQQQYNDAHSNTIRQAQQLLVAEGMLAARHGRGVFVTSTEPVVTVNPVDTLLEVRDKLTTVLTALSKQRVLTFECDDDIEIETLKDALRTYIRSRSSTTGRSAAPDHTDRIAAAERLLDRLSKLDRPAQ